MSLPRFLGTYGATLDAEGRIQLPAAIRDELNVRSPDFRLMATLDADGSIALRERSDWEDWTRLLLGARSVPSQRDRQTLLTVAAHTAPVKCDKQGRVRIPDALLALVGLDRGPSGARDVVLTGAFQELRVWSQAGWESFSDRVRPLLSAGLDELLGTLGDPPGGARDATSPEE